MSFCPNYSDPKFKEVIAALDNDPVKATQYYMNYNGDLDTLYEDVVMKQDIPELDAVKASFEKLSKLDADEAIPTNDEELKSNISKLVEHINQRSSGLDMVVINDPQKLWKGRMVNGIIPTINLAYATLDTPFHEMSHPFLGYLRLANPLKFNALYDELTKTKEFEAVRDEALSKVQTDYPEYVVGTSDFKDEVLATAIGYAARNKVSYKFKNLIKKILKALADLFGFDYNQRKRIELDKADISLKEFIEYITDPDVELVYPAKFDLSELNNSPLLDDINNIISNDPQEYELIQADLQSPANNIEGYYPYAPEETVEDTNVSVGDEAFFMELARELAEELINNTPEEVDEESMQQMENAAINIVKEAELSPEEKSRLESEFNQIIQSFRNNYQNMELPFNLGNLLKLPKKEYKPRTEKEYIKDTELEEAAVEGDKVKLSSKFLKYLQKNPNGQTMLSKPFKIDGLTEYEKEILEVFRIKTIDEVKAWAEGNKAKAPERIDNKRLANKLEKFIYDNYLWQTFDTPFQTYTYAINKGINLNKVDPNNIGGYEVMIYNGFLSNRGHLYDMPKLGIGKHIFSGKNTLGWFIYYKLGDKTFIYELQSDFVDGDNQVYATQAKSKALTARRALERILNILPNSDTTIKDRIKEYESALESIRETKIQVSEQIKSHPYLSLLDMRFTPKQIRVIQRILKGKDSETIKKNLQKFMGTDYIPLPKGYTWSKIQKDINEYMEKAKDFTVLDPFARRSRGWISKLEYGRYIRKNQLNERQIDQKIEKLKYQLQRHEAIQKNPKVRKFINDFFNATEARYNLYFLKSGVANAKALRIVKDTEALKTSWFQKSLITSILYAKAKGDKVIYLPTAEFMAQIGDADTPYATPYDVQNTGPKTNISEIPLGFYNVYQEESATAKQIIDAVRTKAAIASGYRYISHFNVEFESLNHILNISRVPNSQSGRLQSEIPTYNVLEFDSNGNVKLKKIKFDREVTEGNLEKTWKLLVGDAPTVVTVRIGSEYYYIKYDSSNPAFLDALLDMYNNRVDKNTYEGTGGVWNALKKLKGVEYEITDIPELKGKVVKVDISNFNEDSLDRFSKIDSPVSKFKTLVKLYRKEISGLQRMKVINRVKTANMKLNTRFKVVFKQVGEADLWTWEIIDTLKQKPKGDTSNQLQIEFYNEPRGNDPTINDPNTITGAALMLSDGVFDTINDVADANTVSLNGLNELAKTLASRFGETEYEFITVEQAQSMLGSRYNNQPAFFYNGRAYFIKNRVHGGIVFHEFAHPFVMALEYYNPELFNKLYEELITTPEGMGIMQDMVDAKYDLAEGSQGYKREMMVRALQARFKMDKFMRKPSTGFAKVIKDILYFFKRKLREIFGKKIDISKLDVNTSLDDLMTILEKGGQFNIDRNIVTNEDVESYYESNKQFIEEMSLLDSNTQQALLKEAYDEVVRFITLLQNNKNYERLYEVLKDEFSQTELEAIKTNLSKHVDIINKRAQSFIDEAKVVSMRSQALVNTIHRLDKVMMKFDEHMDDLVNNIDDPDNGLRAYYYNDIAKHYRGFIDTLIQDMQDIVPVEAGVRQLINRVSTRINNVLNKTKRFDAQVASSAIYSQLEYIGEAEDRKYQEIIADLEERGRKRGEDPSKYINKWYKEWKGMTKEEFAEYEMLKNKRNRSIKDLERFTYLQRQLFNGAQITKEKIELALKGLGPDANPFSSFLEGFLYNPDLVVGGAALFLKNATTEYLVESQSKMNDFFKDVYPLMEAAGFDPNKTDEFFDKITSLQGFGILENDELVKSEVYTMLSIHGGSYRWERDSRRSTIKNAEAEYSYERTSEEKRKEFAKAVKALREWEIKYMHMPYHPYFYDRYKLFTDDDIGIEASARYEEAIQELGAYEYSIFAEDQYIDTTIQREAVRLKYKQLFSRYENGVKKTDFELAVTERLIAFKEKTKQLYEWQEKPGAFIKSLHKYQQEMIDNGIERGSDLFREKTNLWINSNTVIKNKPGYWERRKILIDRYKEIMAMMSPETQESLDISKVYEDIIDLSKPYRNQDNEIEANEMSEAERKKVKEYEEKIEKIKDNMKRRNGLTDEQQARLNELITKAASLKGTGQRLEPWESQELTDLFEMIKKPERISNELKEELQTIFVLLGEMTSYEATVAYVDELNEILLQKDAEDYLRSIGKVDENNQIIQYTPQSIGALFNYSLGDPVINGLMQASPRFKKWFQDNHLVRKRFDPLTKEKKQVYERLYIWNISRPSSESDIETTLITEEGGYTYPISRVPSIRFSKRKVKDNIKIIDQNGFEKTIVLKTPEITGVTKDNRGEWLPRTDVENSPFIDENFVRLRDSSSAEDKSVFAALEALKAFHLQNQEGLSYHSKLYLDVPRYQKENLDLLRTRKKREAAIKKGTNAPPEEEKVKGLLQIMVDRVKQFYYGAKDAPELDGSGAQFNYEKDTMILVRADALDNDITDIPIGGLYKIDHYDVSTDIGKSLLRYMLSTERHKKLLEISPVMKAIQNTVSENRPNPKNMIDKKNFINRAITSVIRPKDKSVREKAIDNMIAREFRGELNTGFAANDPRWQNISNFMFGTASFGFFALNIPSALKNMITPKLQALIMSAGREYMDYISYGEGEKWAFRTMGQLSFEIYKPDAASLDLQLAEILDMVPNRFVEKMGERVSRTLLRDTVGTRGLNFGWLYNFRKWTETESTLAIGGAIMAKQKIKDKDGNEVKFIDAWELNDRGKIQLKKNIDPEWGITYDENGKAVVGKEFKRFKNLIQQTTNLMQGAYAQFEQPEIQRHLLGRMVTFLKRYLTPMLVSRWGFAGDWKNVRPRFNAGLGANHMGYYTSTLRTLLKIVKDGGGSVHYLTRQEKADLWKTFAEVVIVTLTTAVLGILFGWDPDDEDKYEKLRKKSGPLPLPGVAEDPRYPFQLGGFLENHALLLMMQLRSENEAFIPWPNYGMDDYVGILNLKSIAVDPVFKRLEDILTMLVAEITGDSSAYYKRSIGPYYWQQEGGAKINNYLFKTVGITGSATDPIKGVKDLQGVISRR